MDHECDMLITGASGYVGARLLYDLSSQYYAIGTYNNSPQNYGKLVKMDITNPDEVKNVVDQHNPKIIVHAAANASSKACDGDPANAVSVNVTGTKNIVKAANGNGSLVIYLSGTVVELKQSMYEKTKFEAESIVENSENGFVILRPSVVFGMSPNKTTNKPFNQLLWTIEGKGQYPQDTSWKFQPTWIGHISEAIAAIHKKGIKNQILPIVVPELKSKFDIANDILFEFGLQAQAVDEKSLRATDPRTSTPLNLRQLMGSGIEMHSYDDIKSKMINELREKDIFTFQKVKQKS